MPESTFHELLNQSAALHGHLCPRQVLGVRMGIHAAELLGIDLPQRDKRLLTFVETDGCFADGISVSTGCWLGRRTLRCVDLGKVAATFVDSHSGEAVRIHPSEASRQRAHRYAPTAESQWHAYLDGYQLMPTAELLVTNRVRLTFSLEQLVSSPDRKVICAMCGEEIINGREVTIDDTTMCRGCAGDSYFHLAGSMRNKL